MRFVVIHTGARCATGSSTSGLQRKPRKVRLPCHLSTSQALRERQGAIGIDFALEPTQERRASLCGCLASIVRRVEAVGADTPAEGHVGRIEGRN
jgi:hypothetical protein